jgi:RNA polymerase sigma factor for flagellar operon FliA
MDMYGGYTEMASVAAVEANAATEQQQLLAFKPLVRRTVRQLSSQVGGAMDRDDMMQIGLMGLLEALRRYGEPDERFPAFAGLRVRGAILDELRRQDWRPRSVRQESFRHKAEVRELTKRMGREPSEVEVLTALDITPEAYLAYQQDANAETLASFDDMYDALSNEASSQRSPEAELMLKRSLQQALGTLSEREQRVIQLYYEFELSLKEIAAVLELTEARVCQINKAALQKMKVVLQDD